MGDPRPTRTLAEKLFELHEERDSLAARPRVVWLPVTIRAFAVLVLLLQLRGYDFGLLLVGLVLWGGGRRLADRQARLRERITELEREITRVEEGANSA